MLPVGSKNQEWGGRAGNFPFLLKSVLFDFLTCTRITL